ncbi:hypothetical protein C6501_12830 [Candidatus Poribacteria bacterium]|nr:MAG: hypothetical protein C6501_12830 [Candidatus Poribacteria bacterium]
MRTGLFVIIFCWILGLSGCILSSTPSLNWSKNIAVTAASDDPKFHDDNIYTEGATATIQEDARDIASQREADKFTEAVLSWNTPQTIQHVVIKAKEGQLEFFEIQYMDDDGKWVTVKEVRDNLRSEYKHTLKEPIVTQKFRLKVPRRWDSKYVGGQSRSRRSETGAPTAAEFRKIQEIELYYALPTPAAEDAPMQ